MGSNMGNGMGMRMPAPNMNYGGEYAPPSNNVPNYGMNNYMGSSSGSNPYYNQYEYYGPYNPNYGNNNYGMHPPPVPFFYFLLFLLFCDLYFRSHHKCDFILTIESILSCLSFLIIFYTKYLLIWFIPCYSHCILILLPINVLLHLIHHSLLLIFVHIWLIF